MTTYNSFPSRNRDNQDGIEMHVWSSLHYKEGAGSFIDVKGTGTRDYDVGVINVGYGFNLPNNSNSEVMLIADGSDTNQKYAFLTLPRDKQRQWKENTGGIQNPTDPKRAIEFNPKRLHIRDNSIAIGNNGLIESDGDSLIFRGNLKVDGDIIISGSIKAKGGIYSEQEGIFNGPVSTPLIKSPSSSPYNVTTKVELNIPEFEEYDG